LIGWGVWYGSTTKSLPSSDYIHFKAARTHVIHATARSWPHENFEASINLPDQIRALEARVAKLESEIGVVDELSWEVAIDWARRFFDQNVGKSFFPDDLAQAIGTSVSQAIELCAALEKEGAVSGRNNDR
jgi:hypothetical protein